MIHNVVLFGIRELVAYNVLYMYSFYCGFYWGNPSSAGTFQPPLVIKPTLEASSSKNDLEGMDGKSTNC